MIEMLRRLLELDDDELRNCPDFSDMLGHLGMLETDDINDIREAMELEVESESEGEPDEGGGDVSGEA